MIAKFCPVLRVESRNMSHVRRGNQRVGVCCTSDRMHRLKVA